MLGGSCCCGAIRFTLASPPTLMGTCHCTRCRKIGASAFVFVKRESFALICGQDAITTYRPEAPHTYNRCFCSYCGTALGEITSTDATFPVAANCFDDELVITNGFHEFVKEKPDWYKIGDDAKQFEEHPHA